MSFDAKQQSAIELAYVNGHFHQAILRADCALRIYPDEGRLWEIKGMAHRALHEICPATDALERASLDVPLRTPGRCALADCYAYEGHTTLAHEMYISLAQQADTPSELYVAIAQGLDFVGDPAMALTVCRWSIQYDPDSPRAWHDFACYLGRCGYAPQLVLNCARRAVLLAPESGRWRVGLVSLLSQAGREDEARDAAWGLTIPQLSDASCACCLRRVGEVFEVYGDFTRGEACRVLAERLETAVRNGG